VSDFSELRPGHDQLLLALQFALKVGSLLLQLTRQQVIVLADQALDFLKHKFVIEGAPGLGHRVLPTLECADLATIYIVIPLMEVSY